VRRQGGFTLVEVLVALVVVALGLTALMVAVSSTARTSGYLRDKIIAQWIALNRMAEVRLTVNKLGDTHDTGEIQFANRKWHYDTRYFDTSIQSMKRIVVRVYPGDAKTKGNPIAESSSFMGAAMNTPGNSNVDWTVGTSATNSPCANTTAGIGNASNGTVVNGLNGPVINGTVGGSSTNPCVNANGTPAVPTTPPPTTPQPTTPTPQ
jgi:general secretion pathway protein I